MDEPEPDLLDEDLLHSLTGYVRLAAKDRAVECIVQIVVKSVADLIRRDKAWVAQTPNSRRADLYAVLRVAAQKMNQLADYLQREGKKHA